MHPSPSKAMSVPDRLRNGAARVRKGWCKYRLVDDQGNVCAMGALGCEPEDIVGFYLSDQYQEPARWILKALGKRSDIPDPCSGVAMWNNQPNQIAENVATTMDYAALLYEEHSKQVAEGELVHA